MAQGPTPDETDVGYSAPIPGGPKMVEAVSVTGREAHISFSPSFADVNNIGTSNVRTIVVESLIATVFQFDSVETLRLSIGGDCDRFWIAMGDAECRLLESSGPAD